MLLTFALAAAVLYFIAAAVQTRRLANGQTDAMRLPALIGFIAALLHGALHVRASQIAGGLDLHFFAALSLAALGIAMLTTTLALARPVGALGIVVYPLASTFALLYALARPQPAALPLGWQIQLHAGLALLAYAVLSLAALVAIMLSVQERALRRRKLSTALRLFPPLTLLESLLFKLIFTGFALLTLALLSGIVFVEDLLAQHLIHKTVLSLLAWMIFGALLAGRVWYGWRGRRAVRLTLIAMVFLVLAFFGSKFVLELVLVRGA